VTEAIIVFKPFDATLSRKGFDCGSGALNAWFREQAGQQEKRDSVRTHLGLATFDSRIASFFSLVAHEVELRDAARSRDFTRRRYPIPTARGRRRAAVSHHR